MAGVSGAGRNSCKNRGFAGIIQVSAKNDRNMIRILIKLALFEHLFCAQISIFTQNCRLKNHFLIIL